MVAVARPRMKKSKRRVRLCRYCKVKPTTFRAPSSGKSKTDKAHDLCTDCFWRLVRKANREAGR